MSDSDISEISEISDVQDDSQEYGRSYSREVESSTALSWPGRWSQVRKDRLRAQATALLQQAGRDGSGDGGSSTGSRRLIQGTSTLNAAIVDSDFSAGTHLVAEYKDSSVAELKTLLASVKEAAAEGQAARAALVRENFDRFVSCKNTIDDVHQRLQRDKSDSTRGDELGAATVVTAVSQAQVKAQSLFSSLLDQQKQAARLRNALDILSRWKLLIDLPVKAREAERSISAEIQRREADKLVEGAPKLDIEGVVQDARQAAALVAKIQDEAVGCYSGKEFDFRKNLIDAASESLIPLEEAHKKFAKFLCMNGHEDENSLEIAKLLSYVEADIAITLRRLRAVCFARLDIEESIALPKSPTNEEGDVRKDPVATFMKELGMEGVDALIVEKDSLRKLDVLVKYYTYLRLCSQADSIARAEFTEQVKQLSDTFLKSFQQSCALKAEEEATAVIAKKHDSSPDGPMSETYVWQSEIQAMLDTEAKIQPGYCQKTVEKCRTEFCRILWEKTLQAAERQLVYDFLSSDTFSEATSLRNQAATYGDKQSVLHSWQITKRPLHVKSILSKVNAVMKGVNIVNNSSEANVKLLTIFSETLEQLSEDYVKNSDDAVKILDVACDAMFTLTCLIPLFCDEAISSISSLKEQLLKISKTAMKEYMKIYFSTVLLAKDWSFVDTAKLVTGKDEDNEDGSSGPPFVYQDVRYCAIDLLVDATKVNQDVLERAPPLIMILPDIPWFIISKILREHLALPSSATVVSNLVARRPSGQTENEILWEIAVQIWLDTCFVECTLQGCTSVAELQQSQRRASDVLLASIAEVVGPRFGSLKELRQRLDYEIKNPMQRFAAKYKIYIPLFKKAS